MQIQENIDLFFTHAHPAVYSPEIAEDHAWPGETLRTGMVAQRKDPPRTGHKIKTNLYHLIAEPITTWVS